MGYCDGFVAATIVCSVWSTLIARMVASDCDVSPVVIGRTALGRE